MGVPRPGRASSLLTSLALSLISMLKMASRLFRSGLRRATAAPTHSRRAGRAADRGQAGPLRRVAGGRFEEAGMKVAVIGRPVDIWTLDFVWTVVNCRSLVL